MNAVLAENDEMELVETTLDVRDFDWVLQRVLYVCALEGALEDGVSALKERGIIADTDAVLVLAGQLREKSAERCCFCFEENTHKTGWLVRPGLPHMPWAELAAVACGCLGKYRQTRTTSVRGWEKRENQEILAKKYHSGQIDGDRVVYHDKCSVKKCGAPFKVTVQNVVHGFLATGLFRGWNRCVPCEVKNKERREQRQLEKGLTQGLSVPGVGLVKRAPRKNALTPITPESLPHSAAHGWGTLGESSVLQEEYARLIQKRR